MSYALRTCELCQASYRPTYGKQRTCGRECGKALQFRVGGPCYRRAWPVCPVQGYGECVECGAVFVVRKGGRGGGKGSHHLTCSQECAASRQNARNRAVYRERNPPYAEPRVCGQCSEPFVARRRSQKYCSSDCSARAERLQRRATEGRAAISVGTRRSVYERDKGRCHLCLSDVRPEVDDVHPWSPTLDHVIPHSRGGEDLPKNLATAHRWCNTVRWDTAVEQARAALAGHPPPEVWSTELFRLVAARIADQRVSVSA